MLEEIIKGTITLRGLLSEQQKREYILIMQALLCLVSLIFKAFCEPDTGLRTQATLFLFPSIILSLLQ
jgi:hypothetical protein